MKGDRYPAEAGVSRSLRRRGHVSASDAHPHQARPPRVHPQLVAAPTTRVCEPRAERRRRARRRARATSAGAARDVRAPRAPRGTPPRARARRVRARSANARSKSVRSPFEVPSSLGSGTVRAAAARRGRVPRVAAAPRADDGAARGAPRGRPSRAAPPARARGGVRPSKSRADAALPVRSRSKNNASILRERRRSNLRRANNKSPARNSASAARGPAVPDGEVERRAPPRRARGPSPGPRGRAPRSRRGRPPRPAPPWSGAYPSASPTERGEAPDFDFLFFPRGRGAPPPPVGDASKPLVPGTRVPGIRAFAHRLSAPPPHPRRSPASPPRRLRRLRRRPVPRSMRPHRPTRRRRFRTSDAPGNARATATVALASSPRRAA